MNLIKLSCQNCNGQIDVDVDNMMAYCPYCGQKLMFDLDQMDLVLAEKEKTKREQERTKQLQIKQEYKEKKDIRDNKSDFRFLIGYLVFTIAFVWFCFYMAGKEDRDHKAKNEIQVSVSSDDLEGKQYEDVVLMLEAAGFSDISLIKDEDLIFGIFNDDGEVASVSINGDDDFEAEDWFPQNATIKITYHTYQDD